MEAPNPIKVIISKNDFIFTKDKKKGIMINKVSRVYKTLDNIFPANGVKEYDVNAILGEIETKNKKLFIVCAKQTKFVGKMLDAQVFKIEKFCYIPEMENYKDTEEDQLYLTMLDNFLERNPLYYSDKIDLTISLLNMKKKMDSEPKSHIFKYTVNQYCWNYVMGKNFDFEGMNEFVYPVINGFFGARVVSEYGEDNDLHFILIGRKDDRRSGMRFLVRGADTNGNVANTVETEELLIYKDSKNNINICSFIQLRGSIPLLWTQEPCFQLNPKISPLDDYNANRNVFRMHIEELFENYGSVCCVNLVDKKKDQKIIGEYYNSLALNYNDSVKDNKEKEKLLSIVWFDFHSECKKMKYENIQKLFKTSSFHDSLNNFGFTHICFNKESIQEDYQKNKINDILIQKKDFQILKTQSGIFRTNCIDSLDRSNVVQSVIGRYFLFLILSNLGFSNIKPSDDDVFRKFQGSFESTFKLLWADHGDGISLAYSGTGALKSDFVRTGKRTLMGSIQDGYLSCKRFYLNNFRDGYNQDCHDLFLGALNPAKDRFKEHPTSSLYIFLSLFLFFTYFIFSVFRRLSMPSVYDASMKKFLFQLLLFLGSGSLVYLVFISYMKKMFIDLHTRYKSNYFE